MLDSYQSIMTTEELAELLRLNERTVLKLAKEGKLPAMKIANQFRYSKEKIIEWMEFEMNGYSDPVLAEMEKGEGATISLADHLFPAAIDTDLDSPDRDDCLKKMLDLADRTGRLLKKQDLLKRVIERENIHTTGIGHGVAFPHARVANRMLVTKTILAVGLSKSGVDFKAIDGQPVKIIVFLAVPQLPQHLQWLSHLARLFNIQGTRESVVSAKNPADVIHTLLDAEKNLIH